MAVPDIDTNFDTDPLFDVVNGTNLAYNSLLKAIGGLFIRNSNYSRYAQTIPTVTQNNDFACEFKFYYTTPFDTYGIMRCGWVKGTEPSTRKNTAYLRIQKHPGFPPGDLTPGVIFYDDAGQGVGVAIPYYGILVNIEYTCKMSYVASTRTFSVELWSTDATPVQLSSNSVVLPVGRTFDFDSFGIHNLFTNEGFKMTGYVTYMYVASYFAVKGFVGALLKAAKLKGA